MDNEDTDMDSVVTTFNTAVAETASEILGKFVKTKLLLSKIVQENASQKNNSY